MPTLIESLLQKGLLIGIILWIIFMIVYSLSFRTFNNICVFFMILIFIILIVAYFCVRELSSNGEK